MVYGNTLAGNAELLMNYWQPPLLERGVRGVVNSSKHSKGDLLPSPQTGALREAGKHRRTPRCLCFQLQVQTIPICLRASVRVLTTQSAFCHLGSVESRNVTNQVSINPYHAPTEVGKITQQLDGSVAVGNLAAQ